MLLATLSLSILVALWYFTFLFLIALARRNNNILDTGWGPGLFLTVLATFWWWAAPGGRPVLVLVLVAVWAMRLWLHVFLRGWHRGEDHRHAHLRVGAGPFWPLFLYLRVFLLRGGFLILVALPALWVATFGGPPLGALDYLGVAVWLTGFLVESAADAHLMRFLKHPANRGKHLAEGLWHTWRHPNYAGEITQWWGIWLIALSVPGGWVTVIGPLVLTSMLLHIAVPLLDSQQS